MTKYIVWPLACASLLLILVVMIFTTGTSASTAVHAVTDSDMAAVHGGACGVVCLPCCTACPTMGTIENTRHVIEDTFGPIDHDAWTGSCEETGWDCYVSLTSWCQAYGVNCSRKITLYTAWLKNGGTVTIVDLNCVGTKTTC